MPETTCHDCDGDGFVTLDDSRGFDLALCECTPADPIPADVLARIKATVEAELDHQEFLEELADRLAAYDQKTAQDRRPTDYELIVWQLHPGATLTAEQWALLDGFEFAS